MSVKIKSTVAGIGPDVVLIHGLFGMGSNLGALSRSLQDRYRVHSVDLPNHGRSDWLCPADIPSMAAALLAWMDREGLENVALIGHSLGGKVAMELTLRNPQRVNALVVADIAPVAYSASHQHEFAALTAVAEARCHSRADAQRIMEEHLDQEMVIQFLLTNLSRDDDGCYQWRFNLEGIMGGYDEIRAAIKPSKPFLSPVLFIKGGDSNYIREQHRSDILRLFPAAVLKIMPGCGHWLHVQEPRLFNSMVGRYLDA
ncbi:MAG: esterase [Halioglobus sp.]|jgi:esterase